MVALVNDHRCCGHSKQAAHFAECSATNLLFRDTRCHESVKALEAESNAWVGLGTSALIVARLEGRELEGNADGVGDLGRRAGGVRGGHGIFSFFREVLVRVGLFRSVGLF